MTVIDNSRDVALHHRSPELLVTDLFTDRGLDQMGARQKDRPLTFDDVGLVAHDRQVSPPGDAGPHDGSHLKNTLG